MFSYPIRDIKLSEHWDQTLIMNGQTSAQSMQLVADPIRFGLFVGSLSLQTFMSSHFWLIEVKFVSGSDDNRYVEQLLARLSWQILLLLLLFASNRFVSSNELL